MTSLSELIYTAAKELEGAKRILLTCHLGPDGDALGSMVALAYLLRSQGKEVVLYNPDLVPRKLKWMPGVKSLVHRLQSQSRFDLTVVVDCGDRKLLGSSFPPEEVTGKMLVLDHHTACRPYGDLFYCDPSAASVGVIVARIAKILNWEIDEHVAVGLYVSLVSDTGSFRYSSTNSESLELAALLVQKGVTPWKITERLYERVPFAKYRLLASAFNAFELILDGKVCVCVMTKEMVKKSGVGWDQVEDVAGYTRTIDSVDCGVLITPARRGGTRVSMRSKAQLIDAGAVCKDLGGGGHPGAAGCQLDLSLVEARKVVEKKLAEYIHAKATS